MSDPRSDSIDVLNLPFVRRLRDLDARLMRVGPRRAVFSRLALVVLNGAVLSLNAWDMHLRHASHRAEDFAFDGVIFASTIAAASVLPTILREGILCLYGLLMLYELTSPLAYFRYILKIHGGDTDIFVGSQIWAMQSVLLVGYGAGSMLRLVASRQRTRRHRSGTVC